MINNVMISQTLGQIIHEQNIQKQKEDFHNKQYADFVQTQKNEYDNVIISFLK